MTDPFFGPLVDVLQECADEYSYFANLDTDPDDSDNDWYQGKAFNLRKYGMKAQQALTSHDPAPVLRVLRAAVELHFDLHRYFKDEIEKYGKGWEEFKRNQYVHGLDLDGLADLLDSVDALLEVPAYREWLEGVSHD